jgi:type I restriction-modification system DNA methylase subunit
VQHILAFLNDIGRAAIVLHPGAAERGSGSRNRNKEKQIRKWFVEQDLIEAVVYLPENLFYNTPSPGILLLLNKNKPEGHRNKLFLINASEVWEKGDPKSFIPAAGIERITAAFSAWREEAAFAKVVTCQEVASEDYNISPPHYIHIGAVSRHRSPQELADELGSLTDDSVGTMSGIARAGHHWKIVPFPDCLIDHAVGRSNQINTSGIRPTGRFPVVDQGQAFIAGYTDEQDKVVRDGLPYVIFGDHTRCFKYVDFPFVLGADGTKVLKPDPARFDPKFFYFAMRSLRIPNRGYNRHYTLLKEQSVPCPAPDEQVAIAGLLSELESAEAEQRARMELFDQLLKSTLEELLSGRMRVELDASQRARRSTGAKGQ